MVVYKLHYFDLRGLGESIRLLFTYAGQDFEDVRLNHQKWSELKDNYKPYGKVPVLEVDGKRLFQSSAILRYLANKFNLAGKDDWEKAKIDEIADFQKDAHQALVPYYYVALGYKQGDKDALRKEVYVPESARIFPQFIQLLKQSESGYFSSSGLTWVDLVIAEWLDAFTKVEPELLTKDYPELGAYTKKVFSLPQLKAHVAKRG